MVVPHNNIGIYVFVLVHAQSQTQSQTQSQAQSQVQTYFIKRLQKKMSHEMQSKDNTNKK